MSPRTSTESLLKSALKQTKERASASTNPGERLVWERRKAILEEELRRLERLEDDEELPKRVFVSYKPSSGAGYFARLKEMLEEVNFEVFTGFDDPAGTGGNILKSVLKQMKRSTVYIGILTPEMKVEKDGATQWSPGVWISEEKGMALALEKPVFLMVHRAIHPDFWEKTTPLHKHIIFDEEDFEQAAHDAVARAESRYRELLFDTPKAHVATFGGRTPQDAG